MDFSNLISDLVRQRYSCRTHLQKQLSVESLQKLQEALNDRDIGPRSNQVRLKIISAETGDGRQLQGLGTYGFIKDPAGFIIGAVNDGPGAMEDFGYILETIILKATELGIGTCWLGGTFTKSRFSRIIGKKEGETIPAVISIGYPANQKAWIDRASRVYAGADRRKSWDEIFFTGNFQTPLSKELAVGYREPLELVRLAPSASNKQPWRVLFLDNQWHFYLQRTKNYPTPIFNRILDLADLQLVDIGIAMSHFELSLRDLGLDGEWICADPEIPQPNPEMEYTITWQPLS